MKPFFTKHRWLGFRRSPALTQNLLQTIFLGFFGFYLLISVAVAGLVAGELFREFFPDDDMLGLAGAFMIYYFFIDVLMRYFLQKFPVVLAKPYLILPVPRAKIIHFLLRSSLLNFFNFLPLVLVLPFFFMEVVPAYSIVEIAGFSLLVLGLVSSANFISFWVSKGSDLNNYFAIGFLMLLVALLFLEYRGIISLFQFLSPLAKMIISSPWAWVLPLGLPFILYFLLFRYFKRKLTADDEEENELKYGRNFRLGWFSRFGRAGGLMDLELRLILRSKRARSYLISSLLILLFPLILGFEEEAVPSSTYLLFGLLMTGMIAMNHGQLMLSWNSMHFDLLLSRGNTIKDIFRAKYYILALSCLLTYILTLPYIFLDPKIVIFSSALLLINASISIYAYMILASFNSLRIDPNAGNTFSFSGFGAAHYLIGIPILFVPFILYYLGAYFGGMTAGVAVLVLVGLLAVLMHRVVIDWCVNLFLQNRYRIAAAFRKE